MPTNSWTQLRAAKIDELESEFGTLELDWLSADELQRYQTITAANRKHQFIAGHYLVRLMAGHHFNNSASQWAFRIDESQSRRLSSSQVGHADLYVSISHSGDWIAAAISNVPIGVDIETFTKPRDYLRIASQVFSGAEIARLNASEQDKLAQQFYLYWTLKEAVAKQSGAGLKLKTARSQTAKEVTSLSDAEMLSWRCPDFVVALAGACSDIETSGVCKSAVFQSWKNL